MISQETKIFYINLDDSIDRNNYVKNLLNKYKFKDITRVSAIDTRAYDDAMKYKSLIDKESLERLNKDVELGKRRRFGSLTLGAIGCTLSHMSIYNEMIKNDIKSALIFEDDVLTDLDYDIFWKRINKLDIPSDSDMYLLSAGYYDWKQKIKKDSNTVNFGRFLCTCAYYITLNGANILYKNLIPILYQVDFQMSMLMIAKRIKIYGYDGPYIFKHGSYKYGTTIQDINCDDNCDILDLEKEAKKLTKIEHFNYNNKRNRTYYILIILLIILLLSFCILHLNHQNM